MRQEEVIFKADYIGLYIEADGVAYPVNFDNRMIREDVVFFDGRSTKVFKTPTGEATSMPETKPPYFKFKVRYYENEDAHNNLNYLRHLTQFRYKCSFTFNYFQGAYQGWNAGYAQLYDEVKNIVALWSDVVIEIPDTPIDNTGRGEGATRGDIEITVYPYDGDLTLPDAPPRLRLGQGDYTDLPNFQENISGALSGVCISTIDGAITNARDDLLAPQAGAILRMYFFDCFDTAGTGGAPASTDAVEFDYSADIDFSSAVPSGGDGAAILFFSNNIKPYITGGTGLYAADTTPNSGEITMVLDIPAFRGGGAGSITLCVNAEVQLATGDPSGLAMSRFESSFATAGLTVDDTDLEAIDVSMTATSCTAAVTTDPDTEFVVELNLKDPTGYANLGNPIPFMRIRFPGGTGANSLTFEYIYAVNASDKADLEAAFSPLPAGTTRGFTYDKKALHQAGAGFDFITNEDYTTDSNTTGTNYWGANGAKAIGLPDGSVVLEGFEHYLFTWAIVAGANSSNFPTHTVRKGFLRTKGLALRFSALGSSSTFPNDEIRFGWAQFAANPLNSYPTGATTFGFDTGGAEWYNLNTSASTYTVDGTQSNYNGVGGITLTGQSTGAHELSTDLYVVGGLRAQASIPLEVPDALDPLDSLYRNPAHIAYLTEIIPQANSVRIDFRIEQQASYSPAITSHSWDITDVASGASLDSGSGGSLTGRNTFSRTVSGADIRTRTLRVRIEFVFSGTTYYTETDVRVSETF